MMTSIDKKPRGMLAGLAAFATTSAVAIPASLVLAPQVLGQAAPAAGDGVGAIVSSAVMASGQDDQFGRWQLVMSQTSTGETCRGVKLLDAASIPGLPALAEGCGGQAIDDHLASVGSPKNAEDALLFGRLPKGSKALTVKVAGRAPTSATPVQGNDGRQYYVGRIKANEQQARTVVVEVTTESGKKQRADSSDPAAAGQ